MPLASWARDPFSEPPPIPFDTPAWSSAHLSYNFLYVPPEALADDLLALGLSYREGIGYQRHGQRIDRHQFVELIATEFSSAAVELSASIDRHPVLIRLDALQRERGGIPFRDRDAARTARIRRIDEEIARAEADLPFTIGDLTLARNSCAASAAILRATSYAGRTARETAAARFRPAIEVRPAVSLDERVAAFLATLPPGRIDRPDLRSRAVAAGLVVPAEGEADPFPGELRLGQRELYRRAAATFGGVRTSRGTHYFRVPDPGPTPVGR